MAYDFGSGDWAQQIADVSSRPEFQNCTVELRDPSLLTKARDIQAGTSDLTGDPVVWTGRARIIGIRAALDLQGGSTANPTGVKSVRIQIPYGSYMGRINRGWQIRVTDGGRNPNLENYLFMVESDFNSGNVASYTIEASVVLDNDPGWA